MIVCGAIRLLFVGILMSVTTGQDTLPSITSWPSANSKSQTNATSRCTTEPGFAGDIGAIEVWLIDWLIDWLIGMINICRLQEGICLHRVHTGVHHVGEPRSRSYLYRPSLKYLQRSYSDAERLLTTYLQNTVLDKISLENHGVHIDGEDLAHLDFTDDIVMMVNTLQELDKMINDIHTTSKPVGLSLHVRKTKVTFNKQASPANIVVDSATIELHLPGQEHHAGQQHSPLGVWEKIKLGWAAFGKVTNIMRSWKVSIKVKKNIFNECVLPVMTYGSQPWRK